MKMRYRLLPNGWQIVDPISGTTLIELELPADAGMMRELALYGIKQLVADGGALDKDAPRAARIAAMRERYDAVRNGQWSNRAGASTARIPDADVFAALVALGVAKPDANSIKIWSAASAMARRRYAERADVREWLNRNAPTSVDADAALDAFMAKPAKPAEPAEPAKSTEPAKPAKSTKP